MAVGVCDHPGEGFVAKNFLIGYPIPGKLLTDRHQYIPLPSIHVSCLLKLRVELARDPHELHSTGEYLVFAELLSNYDVELAGIFPYKRFTVDCGGLLPFREAKYAPAI